MRTIDILVLPSIVSSLGNFDASEQASVNYLSQEYYQHKLEHN